MTGSGSQDDDKCAVAVIIRVMAFARGVGQRGVADRADGEGHRARFACVDVGLDDRASTRAVSDTRARAVGSGAPQAGHGCVFAGPFTLNLAPHPTDLENEENEITWLQARRRFETQTVHRWLDGVGVQAEAITNNACVPYYHEFSLRSRCNWGDIEAMTSIR